MKSIPAFLPLLLLFSCAEQKEPKTINVTGQGKMKVVPDMVEISLRAYSVKPAMKDAVAETQAAVNQIIAVCGKYVVDFRNSGCQQLLCELFNFSNVL